MSPNRHGDESPQRAAPPRLLRAVLHIAPRSFRDSYGDAMLAFQRERLENASRLGESGIRAWARTLWDLALTIALEWARVMTHAPSRDRSLPRGTAAASRSLSMEEKMSVLGQEIALAYRSL